MKGILKESFSSDPSDLESFTSAATAANAIKFLEVKIQTPPKHCNLERRKLLKCFENIIQGMSVLLPGGLHCEAVLATLGKYYKDCLDESDNIALSTCKVLLITYYCLLNLTFYHSILAGSPCQNFVVQCAGSYWFYWAVKSHYHFVAVILQFILLNCLNGFLMKLLRKWRSSFRNIYKKRLKLCWMALLNGLLLNDDIADTTSSSGSWWPVVMPVPHMPSSVFPRFTQRTSWVSIFSSLSYHDYYYEVEDAWRSKGVT